jgi:hypothetical protein
MARTFGTSAALGAVLESVSRIDPDLQVDDLDALARHIQASRHELANRRARLHEDIVAEVASILATLDREERQLGERHRWRMETLRAEALALAALIDDLLNRQTWALGRLINRFRASWLDRRRRRSLEIPELEQNRLLADLAHRRDRTRRIQDDPEAEAERRLALEVSRIESLDGVATSCDARGARGELAVIANLRTLAESYFVLNNLRLTADKLLRYDGKPVQTAQVDHMVVGPTGIFLIETKYWAKEFAQEGAYFDPYEQVARAGLLCHCILADAGLPSRVRGVIACRQNPRVSRHVGYTVVARPDTLAQFIRSRTAKLSIREVEAVGATLQRRFG